MTVLQTDRSPTPKDNHRINRWFFPALTGVILIAAVVMMATTAAGLWDGNIHVQKGQEALNQGNLIEAIRQFSRAQQLCETDILARHHLGEAYQLYGWHDEALSEYEKVWNLSRDLGFRAMIRTGRIHLDRGELSRAAESYERALALNPTIAPVWHELGGLYVSLENKQRAGECFTRALKLDPGNHAYRRALLSLALGQGRHPRTKNENDRHGKQE